MIVVALMVLPTGSVLAKGKDRPSYTGEFCVWLWEKYTDEYTMSVWSDRMGLQGVTCIVGMYNSDWYDGPGWESVAYWKEVPAGLYYAKWFLPLDCPQVDDNSWWWICVYLKGWTSIGGATGTVVNGPCVYGQKVFMDWNVNTNVQAHCDGLYCAYGSAPCTAVQWVGTTLGLPKAYFHTSATNTWTTEAGLGADASLSFVRTWAGVSWFQTSSVSAGYGIPYSSVVSEGVMVGFMGLYRVSRYRHLGESIAVPGVPVRGFILHTRL